MKTMKMYSKCGLLVAIALAAILGAGCRREESSAVAGGLDLKQKRDKVLELFLGQCTACGIPEEKIKNYRPQIEQYLDGLVRVMVEMVYIYGAATKGYDRSSCRRDIASRKHAHILEFVTGLKIGVKQMERVVNLRKWLEGVIIGFMRLYNPSSVDDNSGVVSVLDDLGISDSISNSLLREFLKDEFLDKFLYAFGDLLYTTLIEDGNPG